jgi:hypothetical protein
VAVKDEQTRVKGMGVRLAVLGRLDLAVAQLVALTSTLRLLATGGPVERQTMGWEPGAFFCKWTCKALQFLPV